MKYNKLVRNKVPESIEKAGLIAICRMVQGEDLKHYLIKKLYEEVKEVVNAQSKKELTEEIADVITVLEELAATEKITLTAVFNRKKKKAKTNGNLSNHIILLEVKEK